MIKKRVSDYSSHMEEIFHDENDINNAHTIRTATFQVTDSCNLKCSYCYQTNKSTNIMTLDTAKKFIDLLLSGDKGFDGYMNSDKPTFGIILDFIGGEPLLYPKLIEDTIEYFYDQAIKRMHSWSFVNRISICTNGVTYFEPEVQHLFDKYQENISLNVTLDGNQVLHDSCRVFPDGTGSYKYALAAANDWMSRGNYMGSKITISPTNLPFLYDAIYHMIELGYTEINSNCVFEKGWEQKDAVIFYQQLKKIADLMIKDKLYEKVYCSLFEDMFFKPMKEENNNNWCGGNGQMIACDPIGDIYPCIRMMPSSLNHHQQGLRIGNVDDGIGSDAKCKSCLHCLDGITRKSQSTEECFHCPIAEGCAWCSGYNYEIYGTLNKRATFICEMHKARSLANVYYWNKVYQSEGMNKKFEMHCPKDWALQIIEEDEYEMLYKLSQEEI